MTTFNAKREEARQNASADGKFWRSYVYFFELRVPGKALDTGENASFLFPLVLNPTGISMSEPFAVADTPGVDGGLVVEENGIVRRTLRIEGTTGFKPKVLQASPGITAVKPNENPSFKSRVKYSPGALSGQKHFQALQDRVFRTYADLKRNPVTSNGTELVFHNTKDDEHWRVIPRNFSMSRDSKRSTMYYYSIELLVVGPAEAANLIASADKSTLDSIKDGIAAARGAVELATSALKEVTAFLNELEQIASGVIGVVRDVVGFLSSAEQVISGAATLISAPISQVANLINSVSTTIDRLAASPFIGADQILSSFRKIEDALHNFMLHPELFEDSTQTLLRKIQSGSELSTKYSAEALRRASATSYKDLSSYARSGSGLTAGAENQARSETGAGRGIPKFSSFQEHVLSSVDSLPSLAARYLGDARLWRVIAVANELRPPYISASGLPGTRRPGESLLVPSNTATSPAVAAGTILGSRTNAPNAERILGVDLAIAPSEIDPQLYDVVIDNERGRVDAKTVSGIPNLVQACALRLLVEKGSDQLYRNLGLETVVGLNIPEIDAEILRLRVAQALLADPRITAVTRVELSTPSPDTIEVDLDATVAGIADTLKTSLQVPQTY